MMSDSTRTQAISAIASLPVSGVSESAPVRIDYYGADVFSTEVMKKYLPKDTAKTLLSTIQDGLPLNADIAADVAHAMKQWALERGATHYTHWFQPMTGSTAEKHDSFLDPKGMEPIMSFSGKNLIVSEPDASSFPSGGLRCTFEARGYTAWDPTSPAFIKRHGNGATLCIPTAYCSYTGDALDKKTPLLRSRQALGNAVKRLMKCFGLPDERVTITLGPEQEYFLIDKNFYLNRPDLVQTGRTLFGAPPAKHQQLEDHYFGSIKPRILNFMNDVEKELWRLGIPAKTRHNEVAPAQFELAPLFEDVNLAIDHNMLVMEILRQQASRHGLVCLLHEKPFVGVNGSGKHNNWSISYGDKNLLDPGTDPQQNAIFLTVLAAIIEAVDTLPVLPRDATDRNRTSPFAFTGNKFEFRAPGSAQSCAGPMMTLNTIVAEAFDSLAEELSSFAPETFLAQLQETLKRRISEHKRIIFNGDNYSEEWVKEAERRGLPNLKNTMTALHTLVNEKNVALFEKYGVFSRRELESRFEIFLEEYHRRIRIEGRLSWEMAATIILPALRNEYKQTVSALSRALDAKRTNGTAALQKLADKLGDALDSVVSDLDTLETALTSCHEDILAAMSRLRTSVDAAETLVNDRSWPLPKYREMLFIY